MNYTIHKIDNGWLVYYPFTDQAVEKEEDLKYGERFFDKLETAFDFLREINKLKERD